MGINLQKKLRMDVNLITHPSYTKYFLTVQNSPESCCLSIVASRLSLISKGIENHGFPFLMAVGNIANLDF
jgi:hypothetical protein